MSFEGIIRQLLEPLTTELSELRKDISDLKKTQQASVLGVSKLIYDAKQLQEEFGYSQHEAYDILRAFGAKRGGRRRITFDRLMEYQRGEEGTSTNSFN